MTDETTNLVLEHLRAIRSDIAGLKDEIRGVKTEQTAIRLELRAQSTRIEQLMEDVAGIKVRLDRIETRPGLSEMAK
jgi:septal ring factor EnvC (AmiA/AmiB activator)